MKIYLAGFIQGAKIKECMEWRVRVRKFYEDRGLIFIDPLNGKEFATITPDGLKSSTPPHSIVHRDYRSVIDCDLIVVNMDTFGESRPLTGTICEMAWAWEHRIPIIMITNEDKYREHPFISYFASWVVKDIDELFDSDAIGYYIEGRQNATYEVE